MARFGFVGGSYTSQSPNVNAELCMNWYPEMVEVAHGKNPEHVALYPTPGLNLFSALASAVRSCLSAQGRAFVASAGTFYELSSAGVATNRGSIANNALPAGMAGGLNHVLISSGGLTYSFVLATNTFAAVNPAFFDGNVVQVGYSDGYFIALTDTGRFQISTLEDATAWNILDFTRVSEYPDKAIALFVDHREVWVFGPKATVVYADTGNALFPFDPIPGAFIEQGIAAIWSVAKADNSIFWLGGDERGQGIAWRANGYTPQRVSNHAVEYAWSQYSTISDVVAYSYQDQGHIFYVLYFPTGNATWVYDCSTSMWHQRGAWDIPTARFKAHFSRCHMYIFGKHLVGDWNTGNIYDMNINFLTDNMQSIRRVRRAPHVSNEAEWIFHSEMQVDLETGLGPQPPLIDGFGNNRGPQAMLKWSDDGGHNFSNEYIVDCGQSGNYKTRAIWRRLGRSRSRVYELSVSDPIFWRIVDAYLKVA